MKDNYFEEIQNYYLKLKKTSFNLTGKEREIIQNWYKNNIPISLIKKVIKQELTKYSPQKMKKFNLFIVDKKIRELKSKKIKQESSKKNKIPKNSKHLDNSLSKWIKFYKNHNIPTDIFEKIRNLSKDEKILKLENKAVDYIWKNLSEEKKKQIYTEAIKKATTEFITIDKEIIKNLIKIKIKKEYNFPE